MTDHLRSDHRVDRDARASLKCLDRVLGSKAGDAVDRPAVVAEGPQVLLHPPDHPSAEEA
jgi:hypothetical protein